MGAVLQFKDKARTVGNKFNNFMKRFKENRKRITLEVVLEFVRIRAQAKELSEQREILAKAIKASMLKHKMDEVVIDGCPWMLHMTITDPKPVKSVDKDKVIAKLAKQIYGNGYKSDRRFKALVSRYTEIEIPESQVRLDEPMANPNYRRSKT